MREFFSNSPLLAFFICFFGALFTWFAADQFRDQILSDSHKMVRGMALRYLQILVGLFTVFALGMVLAVGGLLGGVFSSVGDALAPLPTETQTLGENPPFSGEGVSQENLSLAGMPTLITPTPRQVIVPTEVISDVPIQTEDGSLVNVETAVVVNTNGVGANAREVPGLGGAVLQIVPEGTRVTLLGGTQAVDGYTWYYVILVDGNQGWIADRFLDLEQ